jgi:phage shock protein A
MLDVNNTIEDSKDCQIDMINQRLDKMNNKLEEMMGKIV